jgi:hypothetical protein
MFLFWKRTGPYSAISEVSFGLFRVLKLQEKVAEQKIHLCAGRGDHFGVSQPGMGFETAHLPASLPSCCAGRYEKLPKQKPRDDGRGAGNIRSGGNNQGSAGRPVSVISLRNCGANGIRELLPLRRALGRGAGEPRPRTSGSHLFGAARRRPPRH